MLTNTRTILSATLAADPTIPQSTANQVMGFLDHGKELRAPLDRVIRTAEAARLCGVTSKTLRLWALRGALVPVYGGQRKRRTGYTESSVRAILAGRSIKPKD